MILSDFQETRLHLNSLGFTVGSEIWLKLSWDHDPSVAPHNWKLRDGVPEQVVLTGVMLDQTLDLHRCEWQGYDENGNSIWLPENQSFSFDAIAELAHYGATVHYYPNQPCGGISNTHVQQSAIVFYEIDHLDLAGQWQKLNQFCGQTDLNPCCVVFTGGKSLHVYFRFTEPVEAESDWRRIARKLCIIQDADNKVTNPARAMRLAGIARRKRDENRWHEPVLLTVEQWSRRRFSPAEFEATLDQMGFFPFGLSEVRWMEWVSKRNQKLKGKTVDPMDALLDPEVDNRYQEKLKLQAISQTPSCTAGLEAEREARTNNLVLNILEFIPQRTPGSNTYETYRAILIALKNHYGEEKAISLMEAHSPSKVSGWNVRQVCQSSKALYGIGVLFHLAEHEFGWRRPQPIEVETPAPGDFDIAQELQTLQIQPDSELQTLLETSARQDVWNAIAAFKHSKTPIKHPLSWFKRALIQQWKPRIPKP